MAVSVNAGPAQASGQAALPAMSPAAQYQVTWTQVTVTCYGQPVTCWRGELVPASPLPAEQAERQTLADCGALRRVTSYATTTALRAAVAKAAAAAVDTTGLPDTARPVLRVGGLAGPAE